MSSSKKEKDKDKKKDEKKPDKKDDKKTSSHSKDKKSSSSHSKDAKKSSSSSSKDAKKSSSSSTKGTKKSSTPKKSEKKVDKPRKTYTGTTAEILKAEYNDFIEGDAETADIDWVELNEEDFQVILRFGENDKFSVTYPEKYPKGDENFFVLGDGDHMDNFSDRMQEVCDKKLTFGELLEKCAEVWLELGGGGAQIETEHYDSEEDFEYKSDSKKEFDAVDQEFANKKFLEIGSPTASLRLLKDLKNIKRGDPKILGFSAFPRMEAGKNLENLYHWEVRLKFEGELGGDLQRAKSASGIDYVELEMRFSKDYPFQPPFVRVVRPRFQFRTGHVTVGGSICMELLTNSGWRSTNDIESILIQIRAEMQEGGARLESGGGGSYSEHEAWDAFYRAAKAHGWDTKGLDQKMFPTV